MEFWGVEVKSGVPLTVKLKGSRLLHLSQASLSDVKKENGSKSIYLYATVDGKKFVIGTLSQKFPQLQFDMIFPLSFELSHSSKNGSVYITGYRSIDPTVPVSPSNDESESESEEEEELPLIAADKGKPKINDKKEKHRAPDTTNTASTNVAGSKKKVKIAEPKEGLKTVEEDVSSEDEVPSDSSEDTSDLKEYEDSESESVDDETDNDDEEEIEEPPKKVEQSKKRATVSAIETPTSKKAKFVTPQKTESKKSGGHVATPHPSKKDGKTPANQPKQQTPKSGGSHPCKSCNRSFNSDNALQSHTKAKHSGGK